MIFLCFSADGMLVYFRSVNPLEIIGFICGALGVYLTMKENIWCFPVGLANVILSMFLFFEQKLYADSLQQSVYIFLLSYGWYKWLHKKDEPELPITKTSSSLWGILLAQGVLLTLCLGYLLKKYTDASFPWIDSAATSVSFIAQWMIAKKKIENWILWILVNITYVIIYIKKDLLLYAILFAVYLVLAIWAYKKWRSKLAKLQHV